MIVMSAQDVDPPQSAHCAVANCSTPLPSHGPSIPTYLGRHDQLGDPGVSQWPGAKLSRPRKFRGSALLRAVGPQMARRFTHVSQTWLIHALILSGWHYTAADDIDVFTV